MLDEVNGIMISNVVKSNTDCPVYGLVSLVVFMLFFPLRKQPGSIWVEWDIIDITWQCNIQITPTAYWLVPLMVKMGSSSVICICIFDLPFASLYSLQVASIKTFTGSGFNMHPAIPIEDILCGLQAKPLIWLLMMMSWQVKNIGISFCGIGTDNHKQF